MKTAKAIEILSLELLHTTCHDNQDVSDATKLGIEALNRLNYMRSYNIPQAIMPLPSEHPPEDFSPSADQKRRLRESPLGKEPKG